MSNTKPSTPQDLQFENLTVDEIFALRREALYSDNDNGDLDNDVVVACDEAIKSGNYIHTVVVPEGYEQHE